MVFVGGRTATAGNDMPKHNESDALAKELASFVDEFSGPAVGNKTFVRAGGEGGASSSYRPTTSMMASQSAAAQKSKALAEERARQIMASVKGRGTLPSAKPPKSVNSRLANLHAFKEELQQMQNVRAEQKSLREKMVSDLCADPATIARLLPTDDLVGGDQDPYTTNIFLGNLSPDITLEDLFELFGAFGPLASAKILWPRNEEERKRQWYNGFVAYMTRKDAERALLHVQGRVVKGFEMKMSFAKCVSLPPQPVFVPDVMQQLMQPPAPNGLPFNCVPLAHDRSQFVRALPRPGDQPPKLADDKAQAIVWQMMIKNATVRVVTPTDRQTLGLVHRMVEFVVREGPVFEAVIMSREMNNPMFRFLFDNQCPAHIYYRWRLFSVMQGDPVASPSTDEFRMFKGGSLWQPPIPCNCALGMPAKLARQYDKQLVGSHRSPSPSPPPRRVARPPPSSSSSRAPVGSQPLSDAGRDHLEDALRDLTPEKTSVGRLMSFCVRESNAAAEVVECIAESLSLSETPLHKKIARLYLIVDILHNCSNPALQNMLFFRKHFGDTLELVFAHLHRTYSRIDGRLKAEQFKSRVMRCFQAWQESTTYAQESLIQLQNVFLGLVDSSAHTGVKPMDLASMKTQSPTILAEEDVDGVPMDDGEDVDGAPLDDVKEEKPKTAVPSFKSSKWETLDEHTVKQQAVVSTKWDFGEGEEKPSLVAYDDDEEGEDSDIDGVPMDEVASQSTTVPPSPPPIVAHVITEKRRTALRRIEMELIDYQDKIECGRSSMPSGVTSIVQAVDMHRTKLVAKLDAAQLKQEVKTEKKVKSKKSKRSKSRSRSPKNKRRK